MSTTIKTGWLKDKNGDKFAPKTLSSQVQTSDGTLLEDKIQADLNAAKAEVIESARVVVDDALSSTSENPVQNKVVDAAFGEIATELNNIKNANPDWSQTDETALDYIKNKPDLSEFATQEDLDESKTIRIPVSSSTSNYKLNYGYTYDQIVELIQSGKKVCLYISYTNDAIHIYSLVGLVKYSNVDYILPEFVMHYNNTSTAKLNVYPESVYPDGNVIRSSNTLVSTSRKINGYALSSDITLTAADVGAAADSHADNTNNPHEVTLAQLGVTATADELNHMGGVTNNVQTQIDSLSDEITTRLNRTTAVNVADTNYTTCMARGASLNSAETNPTVNGTIAWTYE